MINRSSNPEPEFRRTTGPAAAATHPKWVAALLMVGVVVFLVLVSLASLL